jgi:D-alanyl-D-alanine dipeptidase
LEDTILKNHKWIPAAAIAVALAVLAVTTAYVYIPGGDLPAFEEGELRLCRNEDGSLELNWPEASLTDAAKRAFSSVSYQLELKSGDLALREEYGSPGVFLESFPLPVEVRVRILAEGKNLLGLTRRVTGGTLTATVEPAELPVPKVTGTPGPGALALSWKLSGEAPDFCEIFSPEDGRVVRTAAAGETRADLRVGKQEGDLLLPSYERPLEVLVRAGVRGEGYVLCGPASNTITVERQDLLGDDLNLRFQETAPQVYTLEWDETRGEFYELQEWSREGWALRDTLEPSESFTYDLGRLGSGSHHRFQVVAKDRNGTVRSSEEADFFASISPLYATVWPIIEQPFYEKASAESPSLGKLPGGTALCVLEESGDWFQVRYKDQYGWVDSRFCMINLPEYVGDHCAYDITNSYRSIFKVHEAPIALITDQVIQGFEHIQTTDEHFLVPYLYPCSKKLLSAAQAAEADGYRLKIYEAFRPNEATRYLYDTTAAQLEWAALVYDEDENAVDPVTGWVVDLADGLLTDPETKEKISREELAQRQAEETQEETPEEGLPPDGSPVPVPEDTDPSQPFFTLPEEGEGGNLEEIPEEVPPEAEAPSGESSGTPSEEPESSETSETPEEEPEETYDTYFSVMTNNGRFHLGSFLARVTSAHNRGIALDLTLERQDSGEELEMQSAIHDLSWYSATYLNNENAKLLEKYMTATGMRGLTSEWWHFQDDETREAIGLSSYLFRGVNLAGWTRDETGWRYRNEDGSFLRDTSATVDGKRRTFDQNGYTTD